MDAAAPKRVYVTGVGWVPFEALLASLVYGGVDLVALADAEVVDTTEEGE